MGSDAIEQSNLSQAQSTRHRQKPNGGGEDCKKQDGGFLFIAPLRHFIEHLVEPRVKHAFLIR
jgi:hypothetical protein